MDKHQAIHQMEALSDAAQAEGRVFTAAEERQWDQLTIHAGGQPSRRKSMTTVAAPYIQPRKHNGKFSLLKAIRAAGRDQKVDAGYEIEVSQELNKSYPDREGFLIPAAELIPGRKDSGTVAPNDNLLALTDDDRRAEQFTELTTAMREQTIVGLLGLNIFGSPDETIEYVKQENHGTATYIARDGDAVASPNLTFSTAKQTTTTLSTLARLERSAMYANSPDAESIIRNDLWQSMDMARCLAMFGESNVANASPALTPLFPDAPQATIPVDATTGTLLLENYLALQAAMHNPRGMPDVKFLAQPGFTKQFMYTPGFTGSTASLAQVGTVMDGRTVDSYFMEQDGVSGNTRVILADWSKCSFGFTGTAASLVVNDLADSVFGSGAKLLRILSDELWYCRDANAGMKFLAATAGIGEPEE